MNSIIVCISLNSRFVGNFKKSLDLSAEVINSDSKNFEAYSLFASSAEKLGDQDTALKARLTMLKLDPYGARNLYFIALHYKVLKDSQKYQFYTGELKRIAGETEFYNSIKNNL